MALSAISSSSSSNIGPISYPNRSHSNASLSFSHVLSICPSSSRNSLRVSAISSNPRAKFSARRMESVPVQQLERPLSNVRNGMAVGFSIRYDYRVLKCKVCCFFSSGEYMSLPASQYSVLDAERIERVDESTFRCYVYRFKFFAFEVCPVLLVRVEEQPKGCSIKLLSCKVFSFILFVSENLDCGLSLLLSLFGYSAA